MDHSDHVRTGGGFLPTNKAIAETYWYIIAAICGFTLLLRGALYLETRSRIQRAAKTFISYPTRPRNAISQAHNTFLTIFREASGPDYFITNRWFSWLSPPPLGRSLIILVYWAVIIYMLCHGSILPQTNPYYYEKIGFRAAWVSVTQVPLIYLLASKSSILGFLTNSSHERLNWAHRWVSRTMLVTATLHGAMFYAQWDRVDFVAMQLEMLPMVKYGMGAWFLLVWTFLSSLTPIRSWSYELFVLQHLAAAAVFLWLLWVHVPQYAMQYVWFSVAAVSFDKFVMWAWTAYNNIGVKVKSTTTKAGVEVGHNATIKKLNNDLTSVTVHNVNFNWKAGQHVYLRLPFLSFNPLEAHPFTIANTPSTSPSSDLELIVEKKTGFTKRLHNAATTASAVHKAIITGPLGTLPTWNSYETLMLISASTGITFTLPILDSILASHQKGNCVRRIDVLHVVRKKHSVTPYLHRLEAAFEKAREVGIELRIRIGVTCETCGCCGANCQCHNFDSQNQPAQAPRPQKVLVGEKPQRESDTISIAPAATLGSESGSSSMEKEKMSITGRSTSPSKSSDTSSLLPTSVLWTAKRPNIAEFVRRGVEATGGETMVAVCGGKSLISCTRNAVAALSDERGAHKGTGAGGIECWSECYCL